MFHYGLQQILNNYTIKKDNLITIKDYNGLPENIPSIKF